MDTPSTASATGRTFELETRGVADACARSRREAESARFNEYMLFNQYARTNCGDEERAREVRDFLEANYTTMRDGVGNTSLCRVGADSDVRFGFAGSLRQREKHQLFTRTFHSVPSVKRGAYRPADEDRLQQGEDTRGGPRRACDVLSGVTIDRYVPMIPELRRSVQDARHIVPLWTRGGEPTRFQK